jgi:hypothetical protein
MSFKNIYIYIYINYFLKNIPFFISTVIVYTFKFVLSINNELYSTVGTNHRYLMTRLSLQVVYLWRHVPSTAPPFILWWSNLEILFAPLHCSSPFIGELRSQAFQMEHGPYIAERTQNAVYIVRCLWHKFV